MRCRYRGPPVAPRLPRKAKTKASAAWKESTPSPPPLPPQQARAARAAARATSPPSSDVYVFTGEEEDEIGAQSACTCARSSLSLRPSANERDLLPMPTRG